MKIILIILLFVSTAWADEIKFDKIKLEYIDKKEVRYPIIEIPLASDFAYKKPDIPETKNLTPDEKEVVEYSLKQNGRRLIHKNLKPLKNDYKHDFDRGTVEYTSICRNFSFHKIVIPNGTIIQDSNFTQKEPHTQAIQGKNLTFIGCNLVNVEKDVTWILQGCNNSQIKRVKKTEEDLGNGGKKIIISHQVEDKSGKFNEVAEDVETTIDADSYNLLILRLNK